MSEPLLWLYLSAVLLALLLAIAEFFPGVLRVLRGKLPSLRRRG